MKKMNVVLFLLAINIFASAQRFKVSFPALAYNGSFSGKVFLYMSKNNKEPKDGDVGINFFPCFSVNVKNVMPGAGILIDDKALSYPVSLSDIERGAYFVQAVWDRNAGGRSIAGSRGN